MPASHPPSGVLYLSQGAPNPNGIAAQLYLLSGDPTAAPIHTIQPAPGVNLPQPLEKPADSLFRLKVLHFNDLHGHVSYFTPYGHRPIFSRMAFRIQELRRQCQQNPNWASLVLSGGDDLVGSVFDELLGNDSDSYVAHVSYRLYSQAGVDAAVIGNHDLDWGIHTLARAIRQDARFPILAANLVTQSDLNGLYYPAAIFGIQGVRVGIIGLTTPAEIRVQKDDSFSVADPILTMHNLLPALRPLCDVIIILSHLGRSLDTHSALVRGAGDVELAQSLPPGSVNLIVGGHTHQALNEHGLTPDNIVNDIPIVQAGTLGRFVGEITLTLRGRPDVTNARLIETENLPVHQAFEDTYVQPFLEKIQPYFNQKLGPVANHPDLTTEAIRNDFATGESALANFITDALVARCREHGYPVDFAMIDASCLRTGLPIGQELTFADWFNLMPFADTIELCRITGQQLAQLLQDNACRVDRPGEPHTERGFAQFSRQVRYTIRLKAGIREACAEDIRLNGIPLQQQFEKSFWVACTSFFRELSGSWEERVRAEVQLMAFDHTNPGCEPTELFLRNEMIAYIRQHGGVTEAAGAVRDGRVQVVS